MASELKKNKINFNGKMVRIGIDMHKHFWHITAEGEGGLPLTLDTYAVIL